MTSNGGIPMHDDALFLSALTHFAAPTAESMSVSRTLDELVRYITEIFGVAAAGITLFLPDQEDITSVSSPEFERCQQEFRSGPGRLPRQEILQIADVPGNAPAWPGFAAQAGHVGVKAVASIPLRRTTETVGVLTAFSHDPVHWDNQDLMAAQTLAAVTLRFILTSLELQEHERISTQLQHALETRITVEQAKGIVSRDRDTTPDSAYQLIRRRARSHNATVLSVSRAIIELGLKV